VATFQDRWDYLIGRLRTLPNSAAAVYDGEPEGPVLTATGYWVLEPGPVGEQAATFGVGGAEAVQETILIRRILGAADMLPGAASAQARLWPDRLRALLAPDWTLGGRCTDSTLSAPFSNLPNHAYRERQEPPEQAWLLTIDTYPAKNSAAGA
jgi:hypothetical protein